MTQTMTIDVHAGILNLSDLVNIIIAKTLLLSIQVTVVPHVSDA